MIFYWISDNWKIFLILKKNRKNSSSKKDEKVTSWMKDKMKGDFYRVRKKIYESWKLFYDLRKK